MSFLIGGPMNSLENILAHYNEMPFENLSNKAYTLLEELIVVFYLKPGKIYSEIELSEIVGIGRTPVREAIKKLEYAHMVEIIPRRGIKIAEVRMEDFFLQMEVRRLIENLVAVRAAKFSTPEERERFLELADRYEEAVNIGSELEVLRVDNEFHHMVAECARNPYAEKALIPFHSIARRLFYMQYKANNALIAINNQLHASLMRAIAEGNTNKVAEISEDLLNHTADLIKLQFDFLSGMN